MDILSTRNGSKFHYPDLEHQQRQANPSCTCEAELAAPFDSTPLAHSCACMDHGHPLDGEDAFTPQQRSSDADVALQQLRQAMLGSRMGSRRQGRKCVVIECSADTAGAPGESHVAMEMLREAALGSRQGSKRQGRKCVRFDLEQATQKVMGLLQGLKVDELGERRQFLMEFKRAEFLGSRCGSPRYRGHCAETCAEEKKGHRSETGTRQTRRVASERVGASKSVKLPWPGHSGLPQRSKTFALPPILRRGCRHHESSASGGCRAEEGEDDGEEFAHSDILNFLIPSSRPQSTGALADRGHIGTPPGGSASTLKLSPARASSTQDCEVQVLRLPSPTLSPCLSPTLSPTPSPEDGRLCQFQEFFSQSHCLSPTSRSHSPRTCPTQAESDGGSLPQALPLEAHHWHEHAPQQPMQKAWSSASATCSGKSPRGPAVHEDCHVERAPFPHSGSVQVQRPSTPLPVTLRSQSVSVLACQGCPPRSPPLASAGAKATTKQPNVGKGAAPCQQTSPTPSCSTGCMNHGQCAGLCSAEANHSNPSIICPPRWPLALSSQFPAHDSPRAGTTNFPQSSSLHLDRSLTTCPPPRSRSLATVDPSPAAAHRQLWRSETKMGSLRAVKEHPSEQTLPEPGGVVAWGHVGTQGKVCGQGTSALSASNRQGSPRRGLSPPGLPASDALCGTRACPSKGILKSSEPRPPWQQSSPLQHLSPEQAEGGRAVGRMAAPTQEKERPQSQQSSPIQLSPRTAQHLVLDGASSLGALVLSPRKLRMESSSAQSTSPLQRRFAKVLGQRSIGARMNLDEVSSLYYSDDS